MSLAVSRCEELSARRCSAPVGLRGPHGPAWVGRSTTKQVLPCGAAGTPQPRGVPSSPPVGLRSAPALQHGSPGAPHRAALGTARAVDRKPMKYPENFSDRLSVSTPGFSGRTAENADGARSPATALAGRSVEVGARGPSAAGVGDGTDDRRPLPRVAGGAANHRTGLAGGRAARGNVGASAGSGDLVAGQPGNLLGDAPGERGRRVASAAVGCVGPVGRESVATTAITARCRAIHDGASNVGDADGVAAATLVPADRPGQTPRAAARRKSARAVGLSRLLKKSRRPAESTPGITACFVRGSDDPCSRRSTTLRADRLGPSLPGGVGLSAILAALRKATRMVAGKMVEMIDGR